MKEAYFLFLPFAITACNLLVAVMLQAHHSHSQPILAGEIPVSATLSQQQQTHSLDSFVIDTSTGEAVATEQADDFDPILSTQEEDEDPMLQTMVAPDGTEFQAYVRADINSFYGLEPGTVQEQEPQFNGQAGKFINMSPETVSLWWDGPNGPVYNSDVLPWGSGGTACFATHKFIFTVRNQPDQVLCRFTVRQGTSVYYYDPYSTEPSSSSDPARGVILQTGNHIRPHALDELSAQDRSYYDAHVYNLEFGKVYKNFTGGSEWLTMYPPDRPNHKIWRADRFGQTHHVTSPEAQFHHIPPAPAMKALSIAEMRQSFNETDDGLALPYAGYRNPGPLNLTIKALSCAPRAFEVRNFLSDAEVDHILDLVHQRGQLARSMTGTTGGQVSETRTSSTTWLPRHSDPVVNAVFRRAADVLRMDEALLRNREPGEQTAALVNHTHKINEDLQIVHYDVGQQYNAHYDFGYPTRAVGPHKVRSINLCMYLNDVPAGGETSFPRYRSATGESIDVKPEKGKAMIFYMKNPDGNADDLTQHAALPVLEGEKFFANLWISSF